MSIFKSYFWFARSQVIWGENIGCKNCRHLTCHICMEDNKAINVINAFINWFALELFRHNLCVKCFFYKAYIYKLADTHRIYLYIFFILRIIYFTSNVLKILCGKVQSEWWMRYVFECLERADFQTNGNRAFLWALHVVQFSPTAIIKRFISKWIT